MSSSDLAIVAEGLGKVYRIAQAHRDTLLSEALLARLRRHRRRTVEFAALSDISFEINRGEVVGIIGRNGAGKSTLLKILSRITEPSSGLAKLYGRSGSLLEVGTGFHPELTGRENIFLNGAILGMSRADIRRHFDAIVDFAGVEEFLETPVKRYSSGMYVRLAFAVASHLNPDILIVDEVLAVGDAEFQRKCIGKMQDVAGQGRTVLFVSHNMTAVQGLCNRGIVLAKGRIIMDGTVGEAMEAYRLSTQSAGGDDRPGEYTFADRENPYGGDGLFLLGARLRDASGNVTDTISMGEPMRIEIDVQGLADHRGAQLAVIFKGETGQWLSNFNTGMSAPRELAKRACRETFVLTLPRLPYVAGNYYLDISVAQKGVGRLDAVENSVVLHVADSDVYGTGYAPRSGEGIIYTDGDWEIVSG
ncbi:MAG TPA: ABC transporter ATP-binding protein [Fimbriimonadaceae bacterium]|nr:ABC transporter ATP-binding protein [Fimbriimonadaceae bacterium]